MTPALNWWGQTGLAEEKNENLKKRKMRNEKWEKKLKRNRKLKYLKNVLFCFYLQSRGCPWLWRRLRERWGQRERGRESRFQRSDRKRKLKKWREIFSKKARKFKKSFEKFMFRWIMPWNHYERKFVTNEE